MLPVSELYQQAVKSPVRHIRGRVQIDYTDPFIDQSIAAEANEQARISFPVQTANAVTEPPWKWASLDGSWLLNGEYRLMPMDGSRQIGWWGRQLAGEGGWFAEPYPTLTLAFFSRPIHRLSVAGDSRRGEYPVDFTIRLLGSGDAVLYEQAVMGNTDVFWEMEIVPVTEVVRMMLEIRRWSHEGRQVKIYEFFTSVQEMYEGDDILSIALLEEREIGNGSLPVGNISANEIEVRLSNIDRKFDAGHVQSPLYQLLKANRRIKAWLGVRTDDEGDEYEYVPLGEFWSGDWEVPEHEVYVHTTGRDRLELLRRSTYASSTVMQQTDLYAMAEAVLQDAGLTAEQYWIDEELQLFAIPYAWFEPVSHREALRRIAEACLGQVYADRHGVIRVEGPSFLQLERTDSQLQVTRDDYYTKDQPVRWSEIANYIEVETHPLRPSAVVEEVYRSNEPVAIGAGDSKTVTVYYNNTPVIHAAARLEEAPAGCVISGADYYAWGASITVESSAAGSFELVVDGRPLGITNKERAVAADEASIVDNGKLVYRFPDNPFVQTAALANNIAHLLLASFRNPRRDIVLNWRGNPALQLGDRFTAPDYEDISAADYHVVSQSLEFDGGLRSQIKGRRAIL